jgi:hypothetical protein
MCVRKLFSVCALVVFLAGAAPAQSFSDGTTIPLTVDSGFPLQVILPEKLRFKENEPVKAKVIQPVYAFDREVIPSGSTVEGRIVAFHSPGKLKRFFTMLGGDFTPPREPQIAFDTLVLPNGTRISIETVVFAGAEKVVGANKGIEKAFKQGLVSTAKEPKKDHITKFLWGLSPYHPQYLSVGTRLTAKLVQPLNFGVATFYDDELDSIGRQPGAGSIASVRLTTPLDSRAAEPGTPIEARLVRPLFSAEHRLLYPAGSIVRGEVVDAKAAGKWHRNGTMALKFTSIEAPELKQATAAQQIEGRLLLAEVDRSLSGLRINENGETRIVESKKRFIAPAYAFVKAGRGINDTSEAFDRALVGAYTSKATKQLGATAGSGSGFGIAGNVSGAMVPQIGIGLGFYGAARSVYSTFLGTGRDIRFPVDTEFDIELK